MICFGVFGAISSPAGCSNDALRTQNMGDADCLASGQRLEVTTTDISGGGLGVTSAEEVPPNSVVVVDPAWRGPFPIAGLWCDVSGQERRDEQWWLRLEFADISRERQDDLVCALQREQIRRVGA